MKRLTVYSVVLFFFFSATAMAAETLNMRTGLHKDYVRAVFDWKSNVPYEVTRTDAQTLRVDFQRPANLQLTSREHSDKTAIREIRQLSQDSQNLSVAITTGENARFRDFLVGTKVVIDVYNRADKSAVNNAPPAVVPAAPQKKPSSVTPAAQDTEIAEVAEPPPEEIPAAASAVDAREENIIIDIMDAPDAVAAPPPLVEIMKTRAAPHVVTLSTTESVGMASFIRGDILWIVLDRAAINVPPKLEGPQTDMFGELVRTELKGGVAYRMALPQNHRDLFIYGEGGGLIWRVVITPNERSGYQSSRYDRSFGRLDPNLNVLSLNDLRNGRVSWGFNNVTQILEMQDPFVGDILQIGTVLQSDDFAGDYRETVDFIQFQSPIGIAIKPKIDDLELRRVREGGIALEFSDGGGLALSSNNDIGHRRIRENIKENEVGALQTQTTSMQNRIYDFDRWALGGLFALEENQRILLADIAEKENSGKVQDLLTLAKMNLANERGQEALGFLNFAESLLPDLSQSPEFIAMRGASAALAGKHELAFEALFNPELDLYDEIKYWRTYTLAWLEDWQQAIENMPQDFSLLVNYPRPLLEKMGIKLAEVALRAGNEGTAKTILAKLESEREQLKPWTIAALDYLQGEADRQADDIEGARSIWTELVQGEDDWHRVKAGLALTLLELSEGDIDRDRAIDRLEGLRYAWRGDELEAQTNFLLGRLYIEDEQYLKGFTILKDATTMSPGSDIAKDIARYMRDEFKELLMNKEGLTPLDAIQLYEEFSELTPAADEGNLLGQRLAERLIEADLLPRASTILQLQVDRRLEGEDKARVAVRLGTVYLMDRKPAQAMASLNTARDLYQASGNETELRRVDLLRARGLAQSNRTEEALVLLNTFPNSPDINALRADISWRSGLWDDAALAIQDLILDASIDLNRPLTDEEAQLLLNRAVALNLAGNRVGLNNERRRYQDAMNATLKARLFDIVTRPRNSAIIADRETIQSIVDEVDLFSGFLQSFRSTPPEEANEDAN